MLHILLALGAGVILIAVQRFLKQKKQDPLKGFEGASTGTSLSTYLPWAFGLMVLLGISWYFLKTGKSTGIEHLHNKETLYRTIFVFISVVALGLLDTRSWKLGFDHTHYFSAFVLGTALSWGAISLKRGIFETGLLADPFLTALGVVCIIILWKSMFGPWGEHMRATVLGTFVFWCAYAILRAKAGSEIFATTIAFVMATIPVVLWCILFLSYHKERFRVVLLAFFAGMLSTVPILFYHSLMQKGMELNFFLFKITPLSFGKASSDFVAGSLINKGVTATLVTTLVTYLIVGIIEEVSKYWVLRHGCARSFRSIDDALQLSIIVALGFAFAENLVNPTYFIAFVQQYLLQPASPEWSPFLANVIGRSVLTTMVHVLSTGVLGYFAGRAFFSTLITQEDQMTSWTSRVLFTLHKLLDIDIASLYKGWTLTCGLILSFILHGLFDFIVSLPEVLPGNPATLGALFHLSSDSFLQKIPLTLLPSIFYIVGGVWLLVVLFDSKEGQKEYGNVRETTTFLS